MVPSFKVGQVVGVVITFAVKGVLPAGTFTLKVPIQPFTASLNVMVCGPDETFVNTLLACGAPPSSE